MSDELSPEVSEELEHLARRGNEQLEEGDFYEAILSFVEGLKLIPEPKTDWEATTWLLTAIGEAYFLNEDYETALKPFTDCMHCPGAIGNPFTHLRKGQCHFEIGELDEAAEELTRAYAIEGQEVFEEEDEKYLKFLATRITL